MNRKLLCSTEWGICSQLLQRLNHDDVLEEKINYSVVAEWFVAEGNKVLFESLGYPLIDKYFIYIDTYSWIDLLQVYGKESVLKLLDRILVETDKQKLAKLIEVGHALIGKTDFKSIIERILLDLPAYLQAVIKYSKKRIKPVSASTLKRLFDIEFDFPQHNAWVDEVSNLLLLNIDRNYINEDLIECIINRPFLSPLTRRLLHLCTVELKGRVDNQPQPFADWTRAMPDTTNNKSQWKVLESFIQSPHESAFDFKTNQTERILMERAIDSSNVDLEYQTIKKGSPHTLRIMKNHKSYNVKFQNWLEDKALYEKVIELNKSIHINII